MKFYNRLFVLLLCTLAFSTINAQVTEVDYQIRYNPSTCNWDCYLIIISGSAMSVPDRLQNTAQYSLIVPTGSTVAVAQNFNPLQNNQSYTSTTPARWQISTSINAPAAMPGSDFYSITPVLSPSAFYNNLNPNDTIKLFSVSVTPVPTCGEGIRLFENDVDPSSSAPGMQGGDFSQGFSIGEEPQVFRQNAPRVGPPLPILSAVSACENGVEIDLTASAGSCQSPLSYSWGGPNGYTSLTQDVAITPATSANTGTYMVTVTDNIGCVSNLEIYAQAKPNAGADIIACQGGSVVLSGTETNTGEWTAHPNNPDGASIGATVNGTVNVDFSDIATGDYTFIYTDENCFDEVIVTVVAVDAGNDPDDVLCNVSGIANLSAVGSGTWTVSAASAGTANINSPDAASTFVSGFSAPGIYYLVWNVGTCKDSVQFNVGEDCSCQINNNTLNVLNPNTFCGSTGNITLLGNNASPEGGSYVWQYSLNNEPFQNATGTNNLQDYSVTSLDVGNHRFRRLYNLVEEPPCSDTSNIIVLVVNAIPNSPSPLTAAPNPSCMGTTVNLSAAALNGGSYNWSASSPNAGLGVSSNAMNTLNPLTSGSYTVSVTYTENGCTSSPATVDITINPTPPAITAGNINSQNPLLCSTATGFIEISGLSPNVSLFLNYSKNGTPTSVFITSDENGLVSLTGLTAGTYSNFSFTNSENCSSPVYAGPVVLSDPNSPPDPSDITASPNPSCVNTTISLTAVGIAGATFNWSASSPNAGLGSSTTANNTMFPTMSGLYDISVTQTINGCTSDPITIGIQINDTPVTPTSSTVTFTNPTGCGQANGTITFSGLTPSTQFKIIYNVGVITDTAEVVSNSLGNGTITGLLAGNYFNFKIENLAGCSSGTYLGPVTLSDPVTPNAPTNLTANPNPACLGQVINLSATGDMGATFTWSASPATHGLSAGTGSTRTMTPTAVGTYTVNVSQTVAGCTSPIASISVVVNPVPPAPNSANITSSNPTSCGATNGSITISGYMASTLYTVLYTRNGVAQSASITSSPGGVITISGLNAGTYANIRIQNAFGCTSAASTGSVILTDPNAPPAPSNISAIPNPVCRGSEVLLSVTNNPVATYSWSASPAGSGIVSSTTNTTVMVPTLSGNFVVSVTQSIAGCVSSPATITVNVLPLSPAPTIDNISSSNPSACGVNDGSISISGLSPSTEYILSYTYNGAAQSATITSNVSGVITLNNLASGAYSDFRLQSVDGCPSEIFTGVVTLVDPTVPQSPSNITANPNPACLGTVINLSVTNVSGAIYTWTASSPNAGLNASNSNENSMNAVLHGTYTISVTQTIEGCTSLPTSIQVVVNPVPPTIGIDNFDSSDPTACGASNGSISLIGLPQNEIFTLTYLSNSSPVTLEIVTNNLGVYTISNLGSGVYSNFQLSVAGGCVSNTYAGPITLTEPGSPLSPSNLMANPNPICLGQSVNLSSNGEAGAIFAWSASSSGAGLVASSAPNTTMTPTVAGSYVISVTQSVGGCVSPAATITVTANSVPQTPTSVTTVDPSVCSGNDGVINFGGFAPNTQYEISFTLNGNQQMVNLSSNGQGIIQILGLTAGTYNNFVFQNPEGCSSSPYTSPVLLSDPAVSGSPINLVANPNPTCLGNLINLSVQNEANTTFTWSASSPNAGLVSSSTNSTTMLATAEGQFTISVTKTQSGCTSSPSSIVVNITQGPGTPNRNDFSLINPSCNLANGSFTLNGLTPFTSFTINYTFNGLMSSFAGLTNGNGQLTVGSLVAGNVTDISVVDSQGCSSGIYSGPLQLVDPGLPSAPSNFTQNPGQVCVNTNVNLSVDFVTGSTYSWSASSPNAGLQSSVTNSTSLLSNAPGVYTISVTRTENGCTSPPLEATVLVLADCFNPDFDITYVNINVNGDISTNDNTSLGVSYSTPTAVAGNPTSCLPNINSDGTYSFSCGTVGVYRYYVRACYGTPTSCTNVPLTITVLQEGSTTNPPIANTDYAYTKMNTPVNINILANDKCQSGLNCSLQSPTLVVNPINGTFNPSTGTYTPNNNFVGLDSLRYSVCQTTSSPSTSCAQAWVYITVMSSNIGNTTHAMDDYAQTPLNTPLSVSAANGLLANDRDIEGDAQSVVPQSGSISGVGSYMINSNGSFNFIPDNNFVGPAYIPYEVCDNQVPAACDRATLHLLVEPFIASGSIGDKVWHDLNGDGIQNANEPGIPGIPVRLFTSGGLLVNSTTTNVQGLYAFNNVPAGDYFIEFSLISDFSFTFAYIGADNVNSKVLPRNNGRTAVFTLQGGQTNNNIDAGMYRCSKIGDLVWYDNNKNNLQDPAENGINELRIKIWRNHFGVWLIWDQMTTRRHPYLPSDDGHFEFCVPPGQYYLQIDVPRINLVAVQPNFGNNRNIDGDMNNANGFGTTSTFTVGSGETKLDIDFGFYPMAVTGNLVWIDTNQDGVQDIGEPGVPNVTVKAFDNNSKDMVGEATTDTDGVYEIDYLQSGEYFLKFELPDGFTPTLARQTYDELDSDVDHSMGPNTTRIFELAPGQENAHIDMGIVASFLPVNWVYIKGRRVENLHEIRWGVSSELNVLYYQMERRLFNERNFTEIGDVIIPQKNTVSNVREYQYNDRDVMSNGLYYYRIKQVDIDGKENFSSIVSINHNANDYFSVYPNPIIATTNIEMSLGIESKVNMRLFNVEGTLIWQSEEMHLRHGEHSHTLQMSQYPSGVYNLTLDINGEIFNKKLIKVE